MRIIFACPICRLRHIEDEIEFLQFLRLSASDPDHRGSNKQIIAEKAILFLTGASTENICIRDKLSLIARYNHIMFHRIHAFPLRS